MSSFTYNSLSLPSTARGSLSGSPSSGVRPHHSYSTTNEDEEMVYTTLPSIFTNPHSTSGGGGSATDRRSHSPPRQKRSLIQQHQTTRMLNGTNTARLRALKNQEALQANGTAAQTAKEILKPPLPEFRKKKEKTDGSSHGTMVAGPNNSTRLVASNKNMNPSTSGGPGARKIATNADLKNGGHSNLGHPRQNQHHQSSDEATIGADGTVTFGPNLSLLMSSLAVRFDDETLNDPTSEGHRRNGSHQSTNEEKELTSGSSLLTSRKRADAKKKEWHAMNTLYSKAMADKATSRETWFQTRFNYPILYQPAPNGAGLVIPPNVQLRQSGAQLAAQQQSLSNSSSLSQLPTMNPSLQPQPPSLSQPIPDTVRLLHSASSTASKSFLHSSSSAAADAINDHHSGHGYHLTLTQGNDEADRTDEPEELL